MNVFTYTTYLSSLKDGLFLDEILTLMSCLHSIQNLRFFGRPGDCVIWKSPGAFTYTSWLIQLQTAEAVPSVVSLAAVFRGGALRDAPKNGCKEDYSLGGHATLQRAAYWLTNPGGGKGRLPYQTSYVYLSNLKVCSNVARQAMFCTSGHGSILAVNKFSACTNLVKFNFDRLVKAFVILKIQFQAPYVCRHKPFPFVDMKKLLYLYF